MIPSLYKQFRHWSEKGSVWLYSDPHFDDKDCKMMNPNWLSPMEQVQTLKQFIHRNDTWLCLGDVGNPTYAGMIPCHRVLIMGNHDQLRTKFEDYFNEIYEGPLFVGEKILLSHEPIYGLDFCVNIHGHCHGHPATDIYHVNVCSDVIDWKPISLGAMIKSGLISKVTSIHRITINESTVRKSERGSSNEVSGFKV